MEPCTHCGAPVHDARGNGPHFCCHGCRMVYGLLHDQGLGDYYRLRASSGLLRPDERLPAATDDDDLFANPELQAQLVALRHDGLADCRFYVEGLHCAACVWLLERSPDLDDGLQSARVQFGRNALDLVFDPQRTDPARLAGLVRRLGYRPHPWNDREAEHRALVERRRWTLRTAVAAASAVATMHLAVNLFAGDVTGDLDPAARSLFGWLSMIAALPAVVWCAAPYHRAALGAIRARHATLDLTVSVVVIAGFLVSVGHLLAGRHDVYFDAVAMFIAFLLAGRLIYIAARDRVAADGSALERLLPASARVLRDAGPSTIPLSGLHSGDQAMVETGDAIPADGRLAAGSLSVDAAVLTGESLPIQLGPGDRCFAGTRVLAGQGRIVCEQVAGESRIGRLVAAVRNASPGPSPVGHLVDRLLAAFAPLVVVAALATAGLWWCLDASRAWEQVVAVVLVACPCALGLAAPLVQAIAVARAARRGLLVRDAATFERVASCRHVVLDKTGTLTDGRMTVDRLDWAEDATDQPALMDAIGALCARSGHPVAQALASHCGADGPGPSSWEEEPGRGISGSFGIGTVMVGRPTPDEAGDHGVVITLDGRRIASAKLGETIRPEAADLVAGLTRDGYCVHIASGDRAAAVATVGKALDIPSDQCHAALGPADKRDLVQRLRSDGGVLMVGDGINDAPALAAATVGFGIRGGLEAALAVAGVFATRPELASLRRFLVGAEATRRALRRCLWFSLVYNAVGIAAAMAGWWGPWVCAVAMPASSLTVVALAWGNRAFAQSPAADGVSGPGSGST